MKIYQNLWKSAVAACLFLAGVFAFSACEDQAADPEAPEAGPKVEVEVYTWNLPQDLDMNSEEKVIYIEELTAAEDFTYATLEYSGTRDGYNEFLANNPVEEQSCSPWIKVSCCCTEWAYSSYCYGYCTYKQSCQDGNTIVEEYKTERVFDSCGNF